MHRLACARCDQYEPKDSQEVLVLEAQGNPVQLRQDLLLTDKEREAIDGDVVTFQKLRARRRDAAHEPARDAASSAEVCARGKHAPHCPPPVDHGSWPSCGPQITKDGGNDVLVRYWLM